MNPKGKKGIRILLVIFLLVLLLIIILKLLSFFNNSKTEISNAQVEDTVVSINDENIINEAKQSELEKIKTMNERTRIEYYVANYIKLIEQQNYEKAYSLLNKDYKKNYFSTQKEFENYCKNTFSSMLDVKYNNFERNGEIYVVWLIITDAIGGSKNSGSEMTFVIKENTFNDYELSFSKI